MKKTELYKALCDEAYPRDKRGKLREGMEVNPLACAECESPCSWGIELLNTIDERQFQKLLCGADCNTCRQPCNLRRISQMRNIAWVNSHKEKMRKSWMHIALKPYYEREKRRAEL